MAQPSKRLLSALERNLTDLSNCVLKRRAYNKFMDLHSRHSLDFFKIAMHALRDDMFAEAHRVFDSHKDAASIFYIQRVAPAAFNRALKKSGINFPELVQIAAKLSKVRNRVQFHTAKKDVEFPDAVWNDAKISGNEFIRLTEEAHEILRLMNVELAQEDHLIPNYHGEDVEPILRACEASPDVKGIYVPKRKP